MWSDELTTVPLQHMIGTQSAHLAGCVAWRQAPVVKTGYFW
jgi:hypothetical protein